MTRDKLLEHSLGGIARQISDAQPGALADAMEALEREQKLFAPLSDAARLAELAAPARIADEISSLARINDPLGEAREALGIESAFTNPAKSIAAEMENTLRLPDFSTGGALGGLHGAVGIENDLAETARRLNDPYGVNAPALDGALSIGKAVEGLNEVHSLRDAINAATGSLDVLEEHKRMSDMFDAAQPYRGAAYDAAPDVLRTVSAPSARRIPAPPSRSGGAHKKVTSAKAIGELVREARRKMKLNQQEFADLAGVGRRFVSELEAGKPTLEFDKVMQACAAAGIDVTAASRSPS